MGRFSVGLDLGQARDYSALAVVEHVWVEPAKSVALMRSARGDGGGGVWHYEVRHTRRWELGTPYPVVAADVGRVMSTDALGHCWLFYDATGVGRAVGDMLWETHVSSPGWHRRPWPVTIDQALKLTMAGRVQIAMQRGRFHIAKDMPLVSVLEDEFTRYRQVIRDSGSTKIDIPHSGDADGHGDLAMAVMLAMNAGERGGAGEARVVVQAAG
jgi:hypothetical protein